MWKQHRINGLCVCSRGLICVCLHFIYLSYNLFLCYANTGWVKPCIISLANTHTCSSWLLENKEIITFIVSHGGKCCSSTAGQREKNPNNLLHYQMMSHGVKSSLIHSLCKCTFLFLFFCDVQSEQTGDLILLSFKKVRYYDFNEQHILLNIPPQKCTTMFSELTFKLSPSCVKRTTVIKENAQSREAPLSSLNVSELLHFERIIYWYLPFVVTYRPLVAVRM